MCDLITRSISIYSIYGETVVTLEAMTGSVKSGKNIKKTCLCNIHFVAIKIEKLFGQFLIILICLFKTLIVGTR